MKNHFVVFIVLLIILICGCIQYSDNDLNDNRNIKQYEKGDLQLYIYLNNTIYDMTDKDFNGTAELKNICNSSVEIGDGGGFIKGYDMHFTLITPSNLVYKSTTYGDNREQIPLIIEPGNKIEYHFNLKEIEFSTHASNNDYQYYKWNETGLHSLSLMYPFPIYSNTVYLNVTKTK